MDISEYHDILYIAHERPAFTRISLEQLLRTCDKSMRVWIWQNGLHAETLQSIKDMSSHPNVHAVCVSRENVGLREATNWFWGAADGYYLSKVDDDCLLPEGWGQMLRAAHRGASNLGIIGCWRFYEQDFIPELALRKLRVLPNGRKVMTHSHVQGSGYVMRRDVIHDQGLIQEKESFSWYCARASAAGWIVGWHFPFVHEEHMDDPRSPFFPYQTDAEFRAHRPLSANRNKIETIEEWRTHLREAPIKIQGDAHEGGAWFGWRGLLRRIMHRMRALGGTKSRG